jgi:hypothetical protein
MFILPLTGTDECPLFSSEPSCSRSDTAGILFLRRPLFVDQLDDLWHQFRGNHHNRVPLGLHSGFVFRNLFVFGLIVVVLGKLPDPAFIPSCRVLLFFFACSSPFLRWRLRYARFAKSAWVKGMTWRFSNS